MLDSRGALGLGWGTAHPRAALASTVACMGGRGMQWWLGGECGCEGSGGAGRNREGEGAGGV